MQSRGERKVVSVVDTFEMASLPTVLPEDGQTR